MSANAAQIAAAARQHLHTSLLLGVDFEPVSGLCAEQPAAAPDRPDQAGSAAEKQHALEELRIRHQDTCPHCTTSSYHTRIVFGEGNPAADLMFIGEAPGEEEDRTGRPFVGRAGQKLDDIIKAMGLQREQVYIANVLKSRPPDNRTPLADEAEKCGTFLAQQIRIIRPKVIVALGGPAAKLLLRTDVGITRLRGQWAWYEEGGGDLLAAARQPLRIAVMPTFHPAYILRNYTTDTRQKVWSDMKAVLERLKNG
ncbi:MAG: uracil-DNA glycosylase [Phycisphaerales bacterium]|nr:uracil-DNA glycosylase [Phycisphaerales bacterium]MCI0674928.1 uracil-DNA glycosylase [Phycisphaerales bacterium]